MTFADLCFIDETGYHFPDYPTTLAYVQNNYKSIYGADVYLEADSQDGQFLAIIAQDMYDMASGGAATYNSFSPVTAQGVGLARNVKINGLTKRVATFSTADLVIVGQAGTVLTQAVAIDTVNQKWTIPDGTLIPGGGSITVTATAQDVGAILAAANSITGIFTPTLGWQTVTNPAPATPGVPVETDAELRNRQAISTANPSLTVFEGSQGAVANLPGVTAVKGYENDTDVTDANGQAPHSVQHMVIGGDSMDIAETIALHKTPGTYTDGTTSEDVVDAKGMPLIIRFTRPTPALISVRITLGTKTGWTTDTETLIAAAVAATINDVGIGNDVLVSRLYVPAYLVGTPQSMTFDIAEIELKKNAGSFAPANVTIDFDEYPTCDALTEISFVVT